MASPGTQIGTGDSTFSMRIGLSLSIPPSPINNETQREVFKPFLALAPTGQEARKVAGVHGGLAPGKRKIEPPKSQISLFTV